VSRVYAPAIYPFPDPVLIRQHCLDPTLVKAYAADFCGTATLRLEHEKGWRAPGMTADGCLEIAATALALTLFAGAKVLQPSVPAQAKVVVYRTNLARARGGVNVLHSEPKVFIDDVQVGKMPRASVKRGSVLEFSMAPGTHHIYSDEKSRGASFEAIAGQIYYVRITLLAGGFTARRGGTRGHRAGKYESREAAK
jgi:hypothetical protein